MRKGVLISRKYGFLSLLLWFLVLFLISPLITEKYTRIFINISFSLLLLSTVFTLIKTRSIMIAVAIFAIPTIVLNSYTLFDESFWPTLISLVIELIFIALVSCVMFKQIFLVETVEVNLIFEAFCIYLLLALFWALLYSLVELIFPGSFHGIEELYQNGSSRETLAARLNIFLYFSFVTQTTLGYGDITPVSHIARNLASLQAIMVPFYLTTLVAGLIGILLRRKRA